MIVDMKKITLLCLESDKESTLEALRDLGVLHLTPLQPPESAGLKNTHAALRRAREALGVLEARKTETHQQAAAEDTITRVTDILAERRQIMERLGALHEEAATLEPFGEFEPSTIRTLEEKGVTVRLGTVTSKIPPVAPEGACLFVLSRQGREYRFAMVGGRDDELPGALFPLPARALSVVRDEIAGLQERHRALEDELDALAACQRAVAEEVARLTGLVEYLEARDGMLSEGALGCLQGFCPVSTVDSIRTQSADSGWGLVIADPSPDDSVPTLIHTPKWVSPIKSLFDVLEVLPGYEELDVSVPFLFFFTVFFGILVGDAGYGLIYLVLTLIGRAVFRKAPAGPFWLLGILSCSTMAWGALTGNYLGFEIPALRVLKIQWLLEEKNLFTLCFLLGAIHLTVAHAMQFVCNLKRTQALAEAGWIISTWFMYFLAGALIMDTPFPSWMTGPRVTALGVAFPVVVLASLGLGMLLIVIHVAARFRKRWMTLATLFFDVIGNFSDVVSYIRLYAVGAASLAVAVAFNELALSIGFDSWLSGLLAALILFGGHVLNLVLCVMSVLVHGVRLNTLEFSGHAGLGWTGVKYAPFARAKQQ